MIRLWFTILIFLASCSAEQGVDHRSGDDPVDAEIVKDYAAGKKKTVTIKLMVANYTASYALGTVLAESAQWSINCSNYTPVLAESSTIQIPANATGCVAVLKSFSVGGRSFAPATDSNMDFNHYSVGDVGAFRSGTITAYLTVEEQLSADLSASLTATYSFELVSDQGSITATRDELDGTFVLGGTDAPNLIFKKAAIISPTTMELVAECRSPIVGTTLLDVTCGDDNLAAIAILSAPYPTAAVTQELLNIAFSNKTTLEQLGAAIFPPGADGLANGGL